MADYDPTPLPTADRLLLARFVKRIEKTTSCWLWTAGKDGHGYGAISVRNRNLGAHCVAWELFVEPIPPGLCVLHTCDVPACVRPSHLWIGTHADNVADMIAKGRNKLAFGPRKNTARIKRGRFHHMARLTDADVVAIRLMRASGASLEQLAGLYGISRSNVWLIARRLAWAHVA